MPEQRVKLERLAQQARKALRERPVQRVPVELLVPPEVKVRRVQPDPQDPKATRDRRAYRV